MLKVSKFARFLGILGLLAAFQAFPAEPLDMASIKVLYREGELERAKHVLEGFLRKSGNEAQTREKIFAYKYLGVIYATNPASRTLSENYFYKMLSLAPNAHLADLYVSSTVDEVFEKTQERYRKQDRENQEFDEFGNPIKPLEPEALAPPAAAELSDAIVPPPDTLPALSAAEVQPPISSTSEPEAGPAPAPAEIPAPAPALPLDAPSQPEEPRKGETGEEAWFSRRKTWILVAGATVITGATAVGAYYWLASQEGTKTKVIDTQPQSQ